MEYQIPEWYRTPSSASGRIGAAVGSRDGRLVRRQMYIQGPPQYNYHVKTYGHLLSFGYKDVIRLEAENFDPTTCWGSTKRPARSSSSAWVCTTTTSTCGTRSINRVGMRSPRGEEKHRADVQRRGVEARPALRRQPRPACQLRMDGHLFGSDKTGPLAGVPYDGNDPNTRISTTRSTYRAQPGDVSQVRSRGNASISCGSGPGGPVTARPDVSRWCDSLRKLRTKPGGAPVQSERQVQAARWRRSITAKEWRTARWAPAWSTTSVNRRGYLAQPISDGYLHRRWHYDRMPL